MKKTKHRITPKGRTQYSLHLSLTSHLEGADNSEEIVNLLCHLARIVDELSECGVQPTGSVIDGVVTFETYDSKVARKFGFTKLEVLNVSKKDGLKTLQNLEAMILGNLQPNDA